MNNMSKLKWVSGDENLSVSERKKALRLRMKKRRSENENRDIKAKGMIENFFSVFPENSCFTSTKANKRYAIAEIPLSMVFTIIKSNHRYIAFEEKRKKIPAESIRSPPNR